MGQTAQITRILSFDERAATAYTFICLPKVQILKNDEH